MMGSSRRHKPDEPPPADDGESSDDAINVGMHRVSSRVEADGSAEAVLSNNTTSSLFAAAAPMTRTMSTPLDNSSIPLSRTKSNPLGGMSYAMRRVLSRDDRGHHNNQDRAAMSEQESEGLVTSRVKGIYNRGGVETILDNNDLLSPPPLVKRKSALSAYFMKKVFSKQDDNEWQSALQNNETDNLCQEEGGSASLKGGYNLRQVNSTPHPGMMGNGYALKRTNTTAGYDQQQPQQHQSSLYEEERMHHNPISLVRSRLSSVGQKASGGNDKSKPLSNDDDLSTIAESVESSFNQSTLPNSRHGKKKKKKRSKYFLYHLIFAGMMISAGITGAGVYLLKGGDKDDNVDVANVVTMAGEDGGEITTTSAVKESIGSSFGNDNIVLKTPEVTPADEPDEPSDEEPTDNDEPTDETPDEDIAFEDNDNDITAEDEEGIIIKDEDIVEVEDNVIVEIKETTPADDISLSDVVDASPQVELESAVSNATSSTANENVVDKEEEAIVTNVTGDIVEEPNATSSTADEDVIEKEEEDIIAANVTADIVEQPNATSSTADEDVVEDKEEETTATNVTADIVEQPPISTSLASAAATTPPPLPNTNTITTFYVMADAPYTDYERINLMPKHIEELDDSVEFLVHLGDLSWAKVDKCREGAYDEASTIMKKSRIPTFILPGDNDINDCNSMAHGEEMWTKYFALFDKRYDHSLKVTRWGKLNESFSFIHKEVLYLGLNIIGGRPASNSEKSDRQREHLERIRAILDDQMDDFKVVVLLGHAEPASWHSDFFGGDSGFISMVREMGKPTIHFHGDWHSYYEKEAEYGVENYMRISLDGESSAPPILVTIDTSKRSPVKFDRRSDKLKVACCSEGWPRYDGRVLNTPRPNRGLVL